jgi:hypothetical protein
MMACSVGQVSMLTLDSGYTNNDLLYYGSTEHTDIQSYRT